MSTRALTTNCLFWFVVDKDDVIYHYEQQALYDEKEAKKVLELYPEIFIKNQGLKVKAFKLTEEVG